MPLATKLCYRSGTFLASASAADLVGKAANIQTPVPVS
jgi:hypothetical protein